MEYLHTVGKSGLGQAEPQRAKGSRFSWQSNGERTRETPSNPIAAQSGKSRIPLLFPPTEISLDFSDGALARASDPITLSQNANAISESVSA